MAGKTQKGTTDHDGDGKMGGSKPLTEIDKLEKRVAKLEALARANGWSGA
jgi:hypothetical protein